MLFHDELFFSSKGWCFANPTNFSSCIVNLKGHLKFLEKKKERYRDSEDGLSLSLGCVSIPLTYKFALVFQFIKFFKLVQSYGSIALSDADMFKVIGLIVVGIFLMTFGTYFLSIANLPVLQLPDVNWALVGFVTIIGSIVTFGSAFAVSRLA